MTSTKTSHNDVVVVDGSNIATEGRSAPSLTQLNDAVMAYREEHPGAAITVVVDATFGHRIDSKEVGEFDAAVAHNELVAPPAGAIGRGDAFVLNIANKVGARVLSNDSFQEFHGDYPWLFDEGRLIGGKPVPHIGWVFVERLPVKGPISRKAQRASRSSADRPERAERAERKAGRRSASKEASQPMPVPTAPPPGARPASPAEVTPPVDRPAPRGASGTAVNEVLPFLDFVEHHPIGSSVNGVVESYSSHGAYVSIGDLHGYVPLRLMAAPPPRSAREVMQIGDAVTLVVISFAAARRSVDLAVPAMAAGVGVVATPELEELAEAVSAPPPAKKRGSRKRAAAEPPPPPVVEAEPPAKPPRTAKRKAAAQEAVAKEPAAKQPTAKKAASRKQPAQQAAAKQAAKQAAKKTAAKQQAPAAAKPGPARKRAAKKSTATAEVAS